MLTPEDFIRSDSPRNTSIEVHELSIGNRTVGTASIPISFNEIGDPIFDLASFVLPNDDFIASMEGGACFQYAADSTQKTFLLATRQTWTSNGTGVADARAKRRPVLLERTPKAERFSAVLLSLPTYINLPIVLSQPDGSSFTITPSGAGEGRPCLLSGEVHSTAQHALKPFENLLVFLTFLKGSRCGLGNLIAVDGDGREAYSLLGFTPHDAARPQTNWFYFSMQNDLPKVFEGFSMTMKDEAAGIALRQAIEYYRAANTLRDTSLDMSLIAAHTALEALVNYILQHRAGWSKTLMGMKNVAFSDKMRAAATHLGLTCDLLEHSEALSKSAALRENPDKDAYWLVSHFRNKLVHQDVKRRPVGWELHECWLIAQWLVEVMIFEIIGYRGEMNDRRIYRGWSGNIRPIPLAAPPSA